jgi:hypothetical protein
MLRAPAVPESFVTVGEAVAELPGWALGEMFPSVARSGWGTLAKTVVEALSPPPERLSVAL